MCLYWCWNGPGRIGFGVRQELEVSSSVVAGARAVERTLRVLSAFGVHGTCLSARDLASAAEVPESTAHRLVKVLVSFGYLARTEDGYVLGPEVSRLATLTHRADGEDTVAQVLDALRSLTSETVGLHLRVGTTRVCWAEVESPHRVRVVSGVGNAYDLASAAAGKALVAVMDDVEIDLLCEGGVISDRQQEEAMMAREAGYAMSFGETIPGAHAVASWWTGSDGLAGVLNVTAPADRMPVESMDSLGVTLKEFIMRQPPLNLGSLGQGGLRLINDALRAGGMT